MLQHQIFKNAQNYIGRQIRNLTVKILSTSQKQKSQNKGSTNGVLELQQLIHYLTMNTNK